MHYSCERDGDGNHERNEDHDRRPPNREIKNGKRWSGNRDHEKERQSPADVSQVNKPNSIDSSANLPSSHVPSSPVSLNLQIPNSPSPLGTSSRPTELSVVTEDIIILQLVPEANREKMCPQPSASTPRINWRTPRQSLQMPPVDTPIEVIISSFTTFKFYVRYCCHEAKLQEMVKEMEILGPQAEPVNTLEKNLTCLLKYRNRWYRVRITKVEDRVVYQSLDYGRFHSLPMDTKDSFWIMSESLKQIPSFAICVQLADVDFNERNMSNEEKRNLINEKYLMDIVREGNVKLVRLKTLGGEDLALRLSESGFGDLGR